MDHTGHDIGFLIILATHPSILHHDALAHESICTHKFLEARHLLHLAAGSTSQRKAMLKWEKAMRGYRHGGGYLVIARA